ncbi:hypothetical protein ACGFNP_24670 [Nonomuraea sp. NPDC049269]|uniref:RNA polymerase sigma factor n=1 Tax=Nonomuraea sp. NPDC049269 TaxID=3364349 RepID=UPI00371A5097
MAQVMWRTLTEDVRDEIRDLCDEYGSHLYDYCRTELAQSEAELAVAGALLSAHGHTHRVVDSSLVRPWLYGLARAHRATVAGPASTGSWSRSGRMPDLLPEALRALDTLQRELLDLSVRHGLTHQEIAVIFDVTPPDVTSIVSEAARGVERWFSAVIAARAANGCGQLAAKVSAWATTPTRRNRARISRHIPICPTCRAAPRAVVAATLLRELPIATAPPTLRDRLTWAQPLPDAGELWRVDGFPVQVRGLVEAAPMLISPIADPTAATRGSSWPAAGAAAAGQERKPHRSHRAPTTVPTRHNRPTTTPARPDAPPAIPARHDAPPATPPRHDAPAAIPLQRSDPDASPAPRDHETTIPLARKPAAGVLPRSAAATGPSAPGILAAPTFEAPAAPPQGAPTNRQQDRNASPADSPPPEVTSPPPEPVLRLPEAASPPPQPVLRLPGLVIGGPPVPEVPAQSRHELGTPPANPHAATAPTGNRRPRTAPIAKPPTLGAPVGNRPPLGAPVGEPPALGVDDPPVPGASTGQAPPDASDRGPAAGAGPRGRHPFGDRHRDVLVATARDRQGVFVAASGTRRETSAARSRPAPSAPSSRRDATTTSPHRDAATSGNRRDTPTPDTHRGAATTAPGTRGDGPFATTGTRPDTLIATTGTRQNALTSTPATRRNGPFSTAGQDALLTTHRNEPFTTNRPDALFTTAGTHRDALIIAGGEHRDLLVATPSTDLGPGGAEPDADIWRDRPEDPDSEFWRNRPDDFGPDGRFTIRSVATVGLLVGAGMLVASLAWSGLQSRQRPAMSETHTTRLSNTGTIPAAPPANGPNVTLNPTVVPPPAGVTATGPAPTPSAKGDPSATAAPSKPESKMSDTPTGEVRPQKIALPGPNPPVASLSPSSINLGTRRTGSFRLVCPGDCKITAVSGSKGIAVSTHAFRVRVPASRPGCPGPPATEFGRITLRWTGTSSGDGANTTGVARGSGTLNLRLSWTVANAKGAFVADGKGGGYWTNCG